jgi:GntR family transcriptional regulator
MARSDLDRASALPLWAQLLADLRRRLEDGEFSGAFPSELELVDAYGVSRNTVREALRRLRAEGVIVAGRGRRPLPAGEAGIEQPLGALYSLFRSVEEAGLEQRSEVLVLERRRDRRVAEHLGLDDTAVFFYLERVRYAAGDPLAMDRLWFPADLAAPLFGVDFTRTSFYDELAERTGLRLTGGEERIRAVVPTPAERRALALPRATAALAIERRGEIRGRPVEHRETLVRGDRFGVVATFSAGIGYRLDLSRAVG